MNEKVLASVACALYLPSIAATAALFVLVRFSAAPGAVTPLLNVIGDGALWLFMAAAYGPLLTFVAIPLAIRLGRMPATSSRLLVATWACVFLALAAAAFFYNVVDPQLELP